MKQPLGLPKGSVRAILAVGLAASVVGAVFAHVPLEGVGILNGLATGAIMFYFRDRSS
jgi:hypothetical protein